MTDKELLEAVRNEIRNVHYGLDVRSAGASLAWAAVDGIQKALDMPWVQGAELARRQHEVPAAKPFPKKADVFP